MKNITVYQRVILFLFILSTITAIPSITFAKVVGVFSQIEGKVDILKDGEETPVPVSIGDAVSTGDIIRTKPGSMAEIMLKDETVVILAPETRIKIDDFTLAQNNSREKGVISLLRGKIRANVSETIEGTLSEVGRGSTFEVHSPTAIASIRGTSLLFWYYAGITGTIFKDGFGSVYNPNDCAPSQTVSVNDGQITFVSGQCSPPLPVRDATVAELRQHIRETTLAREARPGRTGEEPYNAYGTGTGLVPPAEGVLFGYRGPADRVSESGELANRERDDSRGKKSRHEQEFSEKHPDKLKDKKDKDEEPKDKQPPEIAFVSAPSDITNLTSANFTITSNEPVTYSYSIDGVTVDSTSLSGLSDGSHTFTVTAKDAAGNTSTASYSWTIDLIQPGVTLITTTPLVNNEVTAGFDFTGDDSSATYSYRIDSGEWKTITGPIDLASPSDYAEGLHTFEIRSTDRAGNSSTDSFTWFFGTRHYSLTGLASDSDGILTGPASGDIYAISAGTQGGWLMDLNGSSKGTPGPSWQLVSGGDGYDDSGSWNAYWLSEVNGTSSGNTLSGTSMFTYLGTDRIGRGAGSVSGSRDSHADTWRANDTGLGTYNETPLAFSDLFSSSYYFYENNNEVMSDLDSSMNGIMGTTLSPFSTPATPVSLYLMGKTNPDGYISWWNDVEGNDSVNSGSNWVGTIAGTTGSDNTEKGMINALYIDASGNAGILKGQFTGGYYPEIGNLWSADGTLTATPKTAGYNPANFSDYLDYSGPEGDMYGQFAGNTGNISSDGSLLSIDSDEIDSGTKWFSDPDTGNSELWGVYAIELGGDYSNPDNTSTFSLDTGGDEWKGWFDYWIAHISGQWNTDKTIGGSVNGRYLTPYVLGSITGNILGSYDTDTHGTWEGIALGEFTETPLAFGGIVDIAGSWDAGPYYSLYGGDLCDCFDTVNDIYGRAGGTLSPWGWDGTQWNLRTVPVVYMGESAASSNDHLKPLIWNDDIYSYNEDSGAYKTFDNGAFYGFIGGVWKDKAIDARIVSLYMDPAGNAGYITGDVAGVSYTEFYKNYNIIFEADGTWTPTQMATASEIEMSPSDFYATGVSTDSTMTSSVAGAFDGSTGSISGGEYWGWTRYIDGQRWGIYDLLVTGYESDGFGYYNPDHDTSWFAKVGGDAGFGTYYDAGVYNSDYGYYLGDITDGMWDGEMVSGVLDGRFISYTKMGSMNGDLLGYYDGSSGSNNWAATSLGIWSGEPLTFSGDFSDYYHYYDDSSGWLDDNNYYSPISGIFGSTVSPFQTPGTSVMFYLMGDGYPDFTTSYNSTLWWASIYGNNYVDTSSTWEGWLGGYTSPDDTFKGMMNGLYTDANGSAGILLSDYFTGHYYPGLSMWEADGSLSAIEMAAGPLPYITSYPDSNLYDNLHGVFGNAEGDISSGDGSLQNQNEWGYNISETRRFADEPWGVYQLAFGGNFDSKPAGATTFTMGIDEGNDWISSSDIWSNYTTGTWKENNTIEGKTFGYVADTSTPLPATWISVGDTLGTFDPAASTWQAVQMGVFLETNRFLSMAQTMEGQAKLAQLNIPYAEVGRATMTGSGNNFTDLSMTDTIFFAYNSGEAPKIWATGNVSGSYTANPVLSAPVPLSGGGLTADFTPRSWDAVNGQWRSDISGSGGFNGSASFKGAGAGTIDTVNATISGTAAGIAK